MANGDSLARDSIENLKSPRLAVSRDEKTRRHDHAESLLKRMRLFRNRQQLCDVTLISDIDGTRMAAHRLVLSACGDYFSAMFMGSLREATEQEVPLGEVLGNTLEILLEYCYTGSIELCEDTVMALLVTARFLQLDVAVAACCRFIVKQLDQLNSLKIAFLAEKHSLNALLRLTKVHIFQHFLKVCKSPEFLQLNAEQVGELLASDDLNISSEQDIFDSLMSWIQYDPSNRQVHFPVLLALVRMPLLEPSFILDNVEPLCDTKESHQLVMKILKWHMMPSKHALITPNHTNPRAFTLGHLLAVNIGTENKESSSDVLAILKEDSAKRDPTENLESLISALSHDENTLHSDHAENILKRMLLYRDSQQLCDVVLISGIDGRRVDAHIIVLSASSDYFSALFIGSLCKTKQQELTLDEVKGYALEALVKYCYTGSIKLRMDTVWTLLDSARFLQLNVAVVVCCSFIAQHLDPFNCMEVVALAKKRNLNDLLRVAKAYIFQHYLKVCKSQQFFQSNADEMSELLASDDLNVASEQDVFRSLMSWIQHDLSDRQKHLPILLALVRLPFLELPFLMNNMEPLCDSNECLLMLLEAIKCHVIPESRALIASNHTKPREFMVDRLLAFGYGNMTEDNKISIESYCPSSDEWTVWEIKGDERLHCGIVRMGSKIIIVGGCTEEHVSKMEECLDLKTMTSMHFSCMNTRRLNPGVTVFEGILYAVGGMDDDKCFLDTVECFDPLTKIWSYATKMLTKRSEVGVAVLDGLLYAVGGRDSMNCHRSVECYDSLTNSWTMRAPMNKERSDVGVAVSKGYLYALGGRSYDQCTTDIMERYDPNTDTWTLMCSLSIARADIGCAMLGNRLFAIGGYDGYDDINIVEEYNTETNIWTKKTPLNHTRFSACVVAVSNHILPSF